MPLKKSELYASLWKSCDELRGGMDASQYKDYVLVLLFMKYVSDKAASRPDYDLVVPEGGSFADMVALKGKVDIGDGINKVIAKLAEANDSLRGAIDVADFNDDDKLGKGREKVERLGNLIAIFESPALDFRGNSAQGDDLLGDAYEYLMRNFATESGKSKGQFYTPAEVSRIVSAVVGVSKATSRDQSIYDPTCGSGSLLLKAHDAAQSATGYDLAIYGQEMDNATAALARMNMVLHDATTAEIWQDNTLAHPYFRSADGGLKTFDYVVANPPFSTKSWTTGFDAARDTFDRFRYGMPPPRNGDYAFVLHMLASLKSTGRAAIILSHGVLFRGNQEALIRRELIRQGFIEAIIGLPGNLFYGTSISACVLVLDKAGAANRAGVFVIDARKGFAKDGSKNRLRAQDIHKIVDTFTRQTDTPHYGRFVPVAEIEANDFNLNIARYIDSAEPEDLQDIEAHLRGGIPERDIDALHPYWTVFPAVRDALVCPANRPGYWHLRVARSEVNATIYSNPEFVAFNAAVTALFDEWAVPSERTLKSIGLGDKPKDLIRALSETLLAAYRFAPLIDPYDVYQRLMDYWEEVFQDDVYLIVGSGWMDAAKPRLIADTAGSKSKEAPDFQVGKQRFKSDLLSRSLVIDRYFSAERSAIEALEAEDAAIEQQITELVEEHGVEGGLLEDALDDKGRITTRSATTRLKAIAQDSEANEERDQIQACLALLRKQSDARSELKSQGEALETKVGFRYAELNEDEIRSLVVEDKWMKSLAASINRELDRVSRTLTARVSQLASRYAVPLPQLTAEINRLSLQVDDHLRQMESVSRQE